MDVVIRSLPETRVAAWRHEGPYGGLARLVNEATAWLRAHKEPGGALTTVFLDVASLLPVHSEPHGHHGPGHGDHGHGGEHADGHGHDEGHTVRAGIWVPLSPRFEVPETGDGDPFVRVVPEARAAVVEHEGDPRTLLDLAAALRRFLAEQGYALQPETRIVHQMPSWDELRAWRAEVQVPLMGPGED